MGTRIEYVVGDATAPQGAGQGHAVVAHVCNDAGGWGRGFVLVLSRRWPQPEAAYRSWYAARPGSGFALGAVQLVAVQEGVSVANMIGQHGYRRSAAGPPVRYEAIETALAELRGHAERLGATVHMPRIGCGLAGGRWELVEPLVTAQLTDRGVPVRVYDLP